MPPARLDLPVPRLQAILQRDLDTPNLTVLHSRADLAAYLRDGIACPFFSKPVGGSFSLGIVGVACRDAGSDSLHLTTGASSGPRGTSLDQEHLDRHPDSQLEITGFTFLDWDAFPGMTMQWDIAPTDKGHVLIEVNGVGDYTLPQIAHGRGLPRRPGTTEPPGGYAASATDTRPTPRSRPARRAAGRDRRCAAAVSGSPVWHDQFAWHASNVNRS